MGDLYEIVMGEGGEFRIEYHNESTEWKTESIAISKDQMKKVCDLDEKHSKETKALFKGFTESA